jgi:hypothetical protein
LLLKKEIKNLRALSVSLCLRGSKFYYDGRRPLKTVWKYHLGLLITIVVLLTGACKHTEKSMTREQLVKYINNKENGLVQEQEVNGISTRVSYQPAQMLVAQELEGEQKKDTATIKELESKYKDYYYFLLKYSKDGKEAIRQLGDFSRYSDMVQVLSFNMQRFVNATTPQKDTLPLADYLFDQTYGMSDGNTILLSFEKAKLQNSKTIDINIAECGFKTGNLKFRFEKEQIEKTPALLY